MENTTKFLQEKELDMVKEFLKICTKYNLKYFMAGGTFLGAVRHKGYIPWDDDIDIGMYRKDYNKFLEVADKELSYPYKIQTYKNCGTHHYYFSHIVDTRYKVRRMGSMDKREEYVWVDIFPYDGLPKGRIKSFLIYMRLLFCRFCYHMAYFDKINIARKDRAKWQILALKLLSCVYKICNFDKDKWRNRIDTLLKRNDLDKCDKVMSFMGVKLQKEIFPKKIYDDLIDYEFEGLKLKGPREYEKVLSQLYGNFMELPPEEKRISHPMEIIMDEGKG
jgi:lipopolysaccharide cholinephosphotransferase